MLRALSAKSSSELSVAHFGQDCLHSSRSGHCSSHEPESSERIPADSVTNRSRAMQVTLPQVHRDLPLSHDGAQTAETEPGSIRERDLVELRITERAGRRRSVR